MGTENFEFQTEQKAQCQDFLAQGSQGIACWHTMYLKNQCTVEKQDVIIIAWDCIALFNLVFQITVWAFLSKHIIITYYCLRDGAVITGIITLAMTCQLEESPCSKWVNKLTQIKGVLLVKLRRGKDTIITLSLALMTLWHRGWEQVAWNCGTSCWSWTTVQLWNDDAKLSFIIPSCKVLSGWETLCGVGLSLQVFPETKAATLHLSLASQRVLPLVLLTNTMKMTPGVRFYSENLWARGLRPRGASRIQTIRLVLWHLINHSHLQPVLPFANDPVVHITCSVGETQDWHLWSRGDTSLPSKLTERTGGTDNAMHRHLGVI